MTEEHLQDNYLKREKLFARLFILCSCLILAHFVHNGWLRSFTSPPVPDKNVVREPPIRPLMDWILPWMHRVFHLSYPRAMMLTDFVSSLFALNLLYSVATPEMPVARSTQSERALTVVALLLFLQFPLAFVVDWQRPETMPSALFLALALFSMQRLQKSMSWNVVLILAACVETLMRGDIVIAFGMALLLLSLFTNALNAFGSRWANASRGLALLFISGGYQYYMQYVKYRSIPYQKGNPISENFSPHVLMSFLLAIAVFVLAAVFRKLRPQPFSATESLIVCAAVLYLPLYFCFGIVGEVRIYVPFLLCLTVPAAKSLAGYLTEA